MFKKIKSNKKINSFKVKQKKNYFCFRIFIQVTYFNVILQQFSVAEKKISMQRLKFERFKIKSHFISSFSCLKSLNVFCFCCCSLNTYSISLSFPFLMFLLKIYVCKPYRGEILYKQCINTDRTEH